jgi:hypothetical protein
MPGFSSHYAMFDNQKLSKAEDTYAKFSSVQTRKQENLRIGFNNNKKYTAVGGNLSAIWRS